MRGMVHLSRRMRGVTRDKPAWLQKHYSQACHSGVSTVAVEAVMNNAD